MWRAYYVKAIILIAVAAHLHVIRHIYILRLTEEADMAAIILAADSLEARISRLGGLITGLYWNGTGKRIPLLREALENADALASSSYPLVPFGNRIRDNRFRFAGETYELQANTQWDPLYLHGEGWQAEWSVREQSSSHVLLAFSQGESRGTPYVYSAEQRFEIRDGAFSMMLSVTNRGGRPLPFGIGFHPHFPMTPLTTLQATMEKYWTEVENYLPGVALQPPADLDFSNPRELPHRWVNNGFQNWDGTARIEWPENGAAVVVKADPLFRHAFIFVADPKFDPTYKRDYFCFEPMSHLADGHNMTSLGDLIVLAPGETLAGTVRLVPQALAAYGD